MKAQKKAQELINNYAKLFISDFKEPQSFFTYKMCALNCVDGILEVLEGKEVFKSEYEYYQEVKKYISYE